MQAPTERPPEATESSQGETDLPERQSSQEALVLASQSSQEAARSVPSPEPFEARQEEPAPRPYWGREKEAEEEDLLEKLADLLEEKPEAARTAERPVLPTPAKNKGGRPRRAAGAPKGRHTSLTGQQRVWGVKQIRQLLMVPGATRAKTFRKVAGDLHCSEQTVELFYKKADFWLDWGITNKVEGSPKPGTWRKKGSHTSVMAAGSTSRACRLPGERGYLGRPDYARDIVLRLAAWAEMQQEAGHELDRGDLIRQYLNFLDSEVEFLRDSQELTAWQQKTLEHLTGRKEKLQERGPRKKLGLWLLGKTGLVERAKQRTTGLSVQDEIRLMESGWRYWDYLLQVISQGDLEALGRLVAQPERFALNRQETVISMSDQIPVWLKPDSGKRLMPRKVLEAAASARKKRKTRAHMVEAGEEQDPEAEEQPRQLVCAAGNPANARSRYTLVARQLVKDFFKPGSEPRGHSGMLFLFSPL